MFEKELKLNWEDVGDVSTNQLIFCVIWLNYIELVIVK